MIIKKLIKTLIPKYLLKFYSKKRKQFYYRKFDQQYIKVLSALKGKERINVAFYLFSADTWKADSVYQALEKSKRFVPNIVICPFISRSDSFLMEELQRCVSLVKENNYRYILGFEGKKKDEIKKSNTPHFDVVFFLNPNPHTIEPYTIFYNKESLNCYIPYSFNIDNLVEYEFNNFRLNLMFRIFALTPFHHNMYEKNSDKRGNNSYVSGFPQLDRFFNGKADNPWKNQNTQRKKIVWGPHWTIPGKHYLGWSCFLDYANVFLQMADKYKDDIELALKPHPFLFPLLEKEQNWGKEKTKDYLRAWEKRENCQIFLGDYVDLFILSDALIHDSGSFTVEYLCLNKPVAYTSNDDLYMDRFNEVGAKAVDAHSIIRDKGQLEKFIIQVINGNDPKKEDRIEFQINTLKADGQAGQRIVEHLEANVP